MREKLIAFILKRINWGKVLPTLLRMVAEGRLDQALGLTAASGIRAYPFKRLYWTTAGLKTFTGMALVGLGAGFETICAGFASVPWACTGARYVYLVGAALTAVGLVDGGTRAPWPTGTPIPAEAKR